MGAPQHHPVEAIIAERCPAQVFLFIERVKDAEQLL